MNIFGKSFLLLISFIIELKCSDTIDLVEEYYETYNKFNADDGDYKIFEKIYFGKIKYFNNTVVFRNFPTENGTNFCNNCSDNYNNYTTFIRKVKDNFMPWPTEGNIEFISVIDFEFDEKGNVYILDEGNENENIPIQLYIFEGENLSKNITISSEKKVKVTNFVIDKKNNCFYIAYYCLNNANVNDIDLGIIIAYLNGTIKMIPFEEKMRYDDNYELPRHFMDNNLMNITKKILSLAISCDSEVLFFCPLSSRKIYSVLTEKLKNLSEIKAEEVNEAYKNDASSSIISSNLGNLYLTGLEENNTIYIAGQIENDLTIFNYKGIDTRKSEKNMFTQTDLSIYDGNLYIISKHIINNDNYPNFTLVTQIYKTRIDGEKSYVYKCAGLAYKWDFKSYIIWGIFILIVCFVLVFVFVGNKEDEDINKKNN